MPQNQNRKSKKRARTKDATRKHSHRREKRKDKDKSKGKGKGQGHDARNVKVLRRALKRKPEDPVLWNEMGLLHLDDHDASTAYDCFSRSIALDGQDFVTHKNRALAELALDQNTAALADLDRAIELVCLDKPRASRAVYSELGKLRRLALARAQAHWYGSSSSTARTRTASSPSSSSSASASASSS